MAKFQRLTTYIMAFPSKLVSQWKKWKKSPFPPTYYLWVLAGSIGLLYFFWTAARWRADHEQHGYAWIKDFPWQAMATLLGGYIALVTFHFNRGQQHYQFETKRNDDGILNARKLLHDQYVDLQDRFESDNKKSRANAALRLAEFALTVDPIWVDTKSKKRSDERNSYFLPIASHLSVALYAEESKTVGLAIVTALTDMARFAAGEKYSNPTVHTSAEGQELFVPFLHVILNAYKTAWDVLYNDKFDIIDEHDPFYEDWIDDAIHQDDVKNSLITIRRLLGTVLKHQRNSDIPIDLTFFFGPNAELSLTDLHKANFTDAFLSFAVLRGANLRDARLNGASLESCDLTDTELNGATFSNANIAKAKFAGSNLDYAIDVPKSWTSADFGEDNALRERMKTKYPHHLNDDGQEIISDDNAASV